MDSESMLREIQKQIQLESNTENARNVMKVGGPANRLRSKHLDALTSCPGPPCSQKINQNCFEKCVPKPGSAVSGSEQTCVTQCMEKYMAAWNHVNTTFLRRIQQDIANNPSIAQ